MELEAPASVYAKFSSFAPSLLSYTPVNFLRLIVRFTRVGGGMDRDGAFGKIESKRAIIVIITDVKRSDKISSLLNREHELPVQ